MLQVITLKDCQLWDDIVNSFNDADVYYLSGYVKACMSHGDGEPLLFYYRDEATEAINVVMKRDISSFSEFKNSLKQNTFFDLSTPYGYGGWIFKNTVSEKVFAEYEKWCKGNNIVSEFVRFHPITKNHLQSKGFYSVFEIGKTISIELTNENDTWGNLSKKNRNVIRKAISNKVIIEADNLSKYIEDFKNVYNQTMDRDNASPYYYFDDEYYQTLFLELKNHAQIFVAKKDNVVVASSIILKFKNKLSYHLSGSLKEFGSIAPTNLLLWKVCKYGLKEGYSTFYLGGGVGSSDDDGLFRFKKSFTKHDPLPFFIGQKIFLKEVYDQLVSMRSTDLNASFFPLYRS